MTPEYPQNMQFNWPALEDVPDILQALADVDMHAIQTSGSCIRNITTDQFAGAAADEEIDPRPFCELLRQWSTSHPEFEWLPRKFKIAVGWCHLRSSSHRCSRSRYTHQWQQRAARECSC